MLSRQKLRIIYFILVYFSILSFAASAECQYEVRPHVNNSSALINTTGADGAYSSYWDLPLNVKILDLLVGLIALIGIIKICPVIFSKVKNVLKNQYRYAIFLRINSSPGSTIPEISREEDINLGTAKYHTNMLQRAGMIIIKKVGKYLRLYPYGTEGDKEKLIISNLRNKTTRSILIAINNKPGITNGELALIHNLKRSSIHWYIEQLLEDGLIWSEKEGRNVKYYIEEDTKKALMRAILQYEKT